MTSKEKAQELIRKFDEADGGCMECGGGGNSIRFALIAVDEILIHTPLADSKGIVNHTWLYWVDVLKELELK